jgi:hypothetical protein
MLLESAEDLFNIRRKIMTERNEKIIKIFEYALGQEHTGISFFKTSIDRMGMGAAVSAFKKLSQKKSMCVYHQDHHGFKGGVILRTPG